MPVFSSLNTRNGTYEVRVPDSFTERRVNRVLEISREYYSKLDRVLDSINSHIHFAGGRGRFSYKGVVEADLDAGGGLRVYATTRITYGAVEITLKRNVLGSKREIIVEDIEEPLEVMVALNYLLRGMRVSEADVSVISSTLLAVATISKGLDQNFTPSIVITVQKAGKLLGGEYSASFKLIDGGEVVLQKGDFSGEHIEGVRDYYLKALSTMVATLVGKGRFSTEAFYGLLSYYHDNRRFLNVFYLRGLVSSIDVKKATMNYRWRDTAYEVLGGGVSFPVRNALKVRWPPVEKIEVRTPVERPKKETREVKTAVKPVERPVKTSPQPTSPLAGAGGSLLLEASKVEKEILKEEVVNKKRTTAKKTVGQVAVKKTVEKAGVKKVEKTVETGGKTTFDESEPATLDNWTIKPVSVPRNNIKELLQVAGERPTDFSGVPGWLKKLSNVCFPDGDFTEKLCTGLERLDIEGGVETLYEGLKGLIDELTPLAKDGDSRAVLSALRGALRVVEKEYLRLKREEKERELEARRREKAVKDFEETVNAFLGSAVRVIYSSMWEKPGVRPLSRLMKNVSTAFERVKKHGVGGYDDVVRTLSVFVEELSKACDDYPTVPPSDYKKLSVVNPELEDGYERFIEHLVRLKEITDVLKEHKAFRESVERLIRTIDKVIEKFSVKKARFRSKVKARVNKEVFDAYVELSRVKVLPPLFSKVKNTPALETANKVEARLEELTALVKRSRLKDKEEVLGLIKEAVETVETFKKAVDEVSSLPVPSSVGDARDGVRMAVELLRGLPAVLPFKPVRKALRKYIKVAGKKGGVTVIKDKKTGEPGGVIDIDGIRIAKPLDECSECPEVIMMLENALRSNIDGKTKERVRATLKAVKLIDEYPLTVVNSIWRKPEKFSRFKSRVLSVRRVDGLLPPAVRELLEKYYYPLAGETAGQTKNGKISIRTRIQSIKLSPAVRKQNYSEVRRQLNSIRDDIKRMVEDGSIDVASGEFYLRQIEEIEKVVDVFEKYPVVDGELHKVGVEALKGVDVKILPSRVRRAVESYVKSAGEPGDTDSIYWKAVKVVNRLTPDDLTNLRYERVNGIISSISRYAEQSGKVARLQADLEVLSKVLKEASEKGVRKLITISSVINTAKVLTERLKKDPARATEEKLAGTYVKVSNAKRDLEILCKTLELARDIISEKEVLSKVDGAVEVVSKEISRAEEILGEIEEIARENTDYTGFKKNVSAREERAGERFAVVRKLFDEVVNSILRFITPEDEKIPDNVDEYPAYVEAEIKRIDTKRAFVGLLDIKPSVGRVRVMMRKYEEETGKEFPPKGKVEALTKFALTLDDLRDSVDMTPGEIIGLVSATKKLLPARPEKIRILIGKRNVKAIIEALENAVEDGETIIEAVKEVIEFSKKTGYNPVPTGTVRELEDAIKTAGKVVGHLKKAVEVDFPKVKVEMELPIPGAKKTVTLKTDKVKKRIEKGKAVVEKKAVSIADGLKIDVVETLPETIQSTDVAKKINAIGSVLKLKTILKGVVVNVRSHNTLVDVARKEYETTGFFSVKTLERLKSSAGKVVTSCNVYFKNADAVSEELKARAKEHERVTREKALKEKLKEKETGVAGAVKKALIVATTGGEEIHIDRLLDEIATAGELVERTLNSAKRVMNKVEELEKEALRRLPGKNARAVKRKAEERKKTQEPSKKKGTGEKHSKETKKTGDIEEMFPEL